jgi:hypothetical protein
MTSHLNVTAHTIPQYFIRCLDKPQMSILRKSKDARFIQENLGILCSPYEKPYMQSNSQILVDLSEFTWSTGGSCCCFFFLPSVSSEAWKRYIHQTPTRTLPRYLLISWLCASLWLTGWLRIKRYGVRPSLAPKSRVRLFRSVHHIRQDFFGGSELLGPYFPRFPEWFFFRLPNN